MKHALQLLGTTALLVLSPLALSDVLGVYVGVGQWQPDVEGSAREAGTGTSLEIDDTFGSLDDDSSFIYAALEHPVPMLPNIMLQQTDVAVGDTGIMTADVFFDGQQFTTNTEVDTDIDFSHTDATLYYELLDNYVSVDLGLTFRMFDGEMTLTDVNNPNNTATQELDGTLPMLYLKGRVDLPLSGFYVSAAANYISYDDHSLSDFNAAVGYQSDGWVLDLGLELGIRTFTFELDDLDDLDADIDLSGTYVALTAHF